jgi:hypothetical protein
MKKFFKRFLLIVLIIFIGIQFIRPARNRSEGVSPKDISTLYNVPKDVDSILKVSCYDCHSNNTAYPWYANVQPVAWWLNKHIIQGKKELNFSEFASYSLRRQYHKLEEVVDEVKDNQMPLDSYTWIHKKAILTEPQKQTLYNWVNNVRDTMEAHYPMDSLVRKKQ